MNLDLRRFREVRLRVTAFALASGAMLAFFGCARAPDPTDTIHKAYDWYIQTLKSGANPLAQARTGLRQLATDAFLTSLDNMQPQLENNPFNDPEAFDAKIGIENVTTSGDSATVRVILAGRIVGKHFLNVYLRKEERRWKIDDVKLVDQE